MTHISVEDRLTELERSNRRWRTACAILIASIGIGIVIAAEKPPAPVEIIQAKRIEVMDPQGRAAIVLQAKEDATSLAVWGPDHAHAAVLVAQKQKASMMLMKNGETPEVFAEAVDQGGQIGVTDGRATNDANGDRAALNISGGPNGFSLFHVVNGKPESRLSFSKFGGGLELRTPGSKAVTRVIGSDKAARVEILNAEGKSVWVEPAPH
jgi:hypothetical protein